MTVTNTERLVIYEGNGAATVWPFFFPVIEPAHITVQIRELGTEVLTTVPNNEYSVTISEDDVEGEVTYPLVGSPLAAGWQIIILREVPNTQPTTITNQVRFYPDVIERALNRVVMQIQQLAEQQGRSLRYQPGIGSPTEIKTLEPNRTLVVDPTGEFLIPGPTNTQIVDAVEAAADALAAQLAAEAAAALAQDGLLATLTLWRGAWAASTEYKEAELARSGGTTYIATADHTSGSTFAADLGLGLWETFAQKGDAGTGTGDMLAENNLSEVDEGAARTNLGLGTAATQAASAFATAAQGTKADTAVQPGDLADVATSGDWKDLINKPSAAVDFGPNPQWVNVTRSAATTYQNDTGYALQLSITAARSSSGSGVQISADGSSWSALSDTGGSGRTTHNQIIPDGLYYRLSLGNSIDRWWEFRNVE